MAGDLSGFDTPRYKDIETSVAPKVGRVEVYKVNHHGSDHSSNRTWLRTIRPRIAIISVGDGNDYGHPTPGTMQRLHAARLQELNGLRVVQEHGPGGIVMSLPTAASWSKLSRVVALSQ